MSMLIRLPFSMNWSRSNFRSNSVNSFLRYVIAHINYFQRLDFHLLYIYIYIYIYIYSRFRQGFPYDPCLLALLWYNQRHFVFKEKIKLWIQLKWFPYDPCLLALLWYNQRHFVFKEKIKLWIQLKTIIY
jgi:hypothetical protein